MRCQLLQRTTCRLDSKKHIMDSEMTSWPTNKSGLSSSVIPWRLERCCVITGGDDAMIISILNLLFIFTILRVTDSQQLVPDMHVIATRPSWWQMHQGWSQVGAPLMWVPRTRWPAFGSSKHSTTNKAPVSNDPASSDSKKWHYQKCKLVLHIIPGILGKRENSIYPPSYAVPDSR